jgi:hypothetical protein
VAELAPPHHIGFALQLAVGTVLIASFLSKVRAFSKFEEALVQYSIVPERLVKGGAATVVCAEGILGLALLTGTGGLFPIVLTAVLFAAFGAAVAINLRRGRLVPCGCFGDREERISMRTLARLTLLIAAAVALLGLTVSGTGLTTLAALVGEGTSSFAYVFEIATLSSFLILAAMWILSLPELFRLLPLMISTRRQARSEKAR